MELIMAECRVPLAVVCQRARGVLQINDGFALAGSHDYSWRRVNAESPGQSVNLRQIRDRVAAALRLFPSISPRIARTCTSRAQAAMQF
jgi:hypothetical protein